MYVIVESKKRDDENEGKVTYAYRFCACLLIIVFRSIVPSILRIETRKIQDQSPP